MITEMVNNSGLSQSVSNKDLGEHVGFVRLRRITGYLSEVTSFNNGKRAELHDRVKHASSDIADSSNMEPAAGCVAC